MNIKPFYNDDGTKYERASDWYDPDIVAFMPNAKLVKNTTPGIVYPIQTFMKEEPGRYAIIKFTDDLNNHCVLAVNAGHQVVLDPLKRAIPAAIQDPFQPASTPEPEVKASPEDIWEQIKRSCR